MATYTGLQFFFRGHGVDAKSVVYRTIMLIALIDWAGYNVSTNTV